MSLLQPPHTTSADDTANGDVTLSTSSSQRPTWAPTFASLYLDTCRLLGRGAFGEVFLVKATAHLSEGGQSSVCAAAFALKRSSVAQISEAGLEKAQAEAQLLQRLGEEHDSILKCFDSRLTSGHSPYLELLLEFAPLGDLNGWLKSHKDRGTSDLSGGPTAPGLPEGEVISFSCDVASGLAHIHSLSPKVLHRDIKPANVVLFPLEGLQEGIPRAKIADFGIAKILETDGSFARAATVIGTPHYFSPEICRGEKYDERSDSWALGCVIYEMVCLRRPFHQAEGNIAVLALRVMEGKYDKELLQQCCGGYNGRLVFLLMGLLNLEIKERLRAADVREPLLALRNSVSGSITLNSVPWWESFAAAGNDEVQTTTLEPDHRFNVGDQEATRDCATEDSWAGAQKVLLGSRPVSPWLQPPGASINGPPTELPTVNPLEEVFLGGTVLPSPKWVRTVDLLSGTLKGGLEGSATLDPPTMQPGMCENLEPTMTQGAEATGDVGIVPESCFGGTMRPDLSGLSGDGMFASSVFRGSYEFGAPQTEWLQEDIGTAFRKSESSGFPAAPSRLAWMGGYGGFDASFTINEEEGGPATATFGREDAPPTPSQDQVFTQIPSDADSQARSETNPSQRVFLRPLWRGNSAESPDGPVIFCFTGDPPSGAGEAPEPSVSAPSSPPHHTMPGGSADPLDRSNKAAGWFEVQVDPLLSARGAEKKERAFEGTARRSSTCGIFALTAVD